MKILIFVFFILHPVIASADCNDLEHNITPLEMKFNVRQEPVLDESLSTLEKQYYFLGEGEGGKVYRVTRSDSAVPIEAKIYTDPFHLAFEQRSLNLLRKVPPVPGVKVIKEIAVDRLTVYFEDTYGEPLNICLWRLSETDQALVLAKVAAFEASLNAYMKKTYSHVNLNKRELRSLARHFRFQNDKLTREEAMELALAEYEKSPSATWGNDFYTPFHLNPFKPGFLLRARVNLNRKQYILNPYTLDLTIVDGQ